MPHTFGHQKRGSNLSFAHKKHQQVGARYARLLGTGTQYHVAAVGELFHVKFVKPNGEPLVVVVRSARQRAKRWPKFTAFDFYCLFQAKKQLEIELGGLSVGTATARMKGNELWVMETGQSPVRVP